MLSFLQYEILFQQQQAQQKGSMKQIQGKAADIDKQLKKHFRSEQIYTDHKRSEEKRPFFATVILPRSNKNAYQNKSLNSQIKEKSYKMSRFNDKENLIQKERIVLKRILQTKMQKTRGKRWQTEVEEDFSLKKHSLNELESLQVQILKPTQRYFHHLNNVKMVQKILLAKPSKEINRQSQKSFFKKQQRYVFNLRKMSFNGSKEIVHKKVWID